MKVLFVSSSRKGKGISPFIKSQADSLTMAGVYVDYFLINGSGVNSYIKSIPKIRKHIKQKEFNVIHAHYGFSGIAVRLAVPNAKLVVSFLGDDLEGSVNSQGNYSFKGKVFVHINKLFARWLFNFNIVKSKSLSNKIKNVKNKITIPNGIDFDVFYPVNREAACKHLRLNPEIAYCLFPSTPKRIVKNFKLFEKALELLDNNIKPLILENVKPEDVFLYYNAASVMVLTSYHEGSPNVVKEALACNCPVVSTEVGDVKEVLRNIDGCYIANFEPEDIADKINKALTLDKRTNGREFIKHLESNVIAQKIIAVYKIIIDK